MKKTFTVGITVLLLIGMQSVIKAQTLTNIPNNGPNTRFGSQDVFSNNIVRPALSIRGFDSSTLSGGSNNGLGMKQILEGYLSEDERFVDILEQILIPEANSNLITPSGSLEDKRKDMDINSRITQSRAFVTLATYILEKNGYSSESQSAFGKTHAVALDSLRSALLNPPSGNHIGLDLVTDESWTENENIESIATSLLNGELDPVKFNESLANMARALDLYLALENAYKYYADQGMENSTYYYTQAG